MSDAYEIDGVKVTPAAGGYYDLNHSSLSEPERVRGKDAADKRAAAIAKAAAKDSKGAGSSTSTSGDGGGDGGSMQPQGDMVTSDLGKGSNETDPRSPAEQAQERQEGLPDPTPPAPPAEPPVEDPAEAKRLQKLQEASDAKDDEIAALKGQLKEQTDRGDKLERAAEGLVKTVTSTAGEEPKPDLNLAIPTRFTGDMDKDGKAAMKAAGLSYTRIVLEESEHIPPTGLFVAVNGRPYMIMPGEEVDVPDFVLGVLDDAVTSAPVVDSNTRKVLGYRNRSKYPYRRV